MSPGRALLALLALSLCACTTRRILAIESTPPGAVVRLDELVIGETPLEWDFQHYGKRRLTLYLAGYRTWSQSIEFVPPWHARFPVDIVTQVLIPMGLDDRHELAVDLTPDDGVHGDPDLEAFVQRALERRRKELRRRERAAAAQRERDNRSGTESNTETGPQTNPETNTGANTGASAVEGARRAAEGAAELLP